MALDVYRTARAAARRHQLVSRCWEVPSASCPKGLQVHRRPPQHDVRLKQTSCGHAGSAHASNRPHGQERRRTRCQRAHEALGHPPRTNVVCTCAGEGRVTCVQKNPFRAHSHEFNQPKSATCEAEGASKSYVPISPPHTHDGRVPRAAPYSAKPRKLVPVRDGDQAALHTTVIRLDKMPRKGLGECAKRVTL